jgi:hypothetical protein
MKHWNYRISRGPDDTGKEMLSIYEKGGDKDFDSICGIWGELTQESKANAKLISKAPEMLEALKWLMDNQNNDSMYVSATEMNPEFTEDTLISKMLKIESLINEIEK